MSIKPFKLYPNETQVIDFAFLAGSSPEKTQLKKRGDTLIGASVIKQKTNTDLCLNYYKSNNDTIFPSYQKISTLTINYNNLNKIIHIYPNPSNGNFTLKLPESMVNKELLIINTEGKIVNKQICISNIENIQFTH